MLLYAVLVFVGWMFSVATILLSYAVDPVAVGVALRMDSIYVLWQMIRDFFNLFFILTLLFIAFATIFQIDSFNYKKTLGKLLLMALLVNFSFPISRFIIDAANVPMYFFMESMFTNQADKSAKNIAEVAFSASNMKKVLIPDYGDLKTTRSETATALLASIVFLFLLTVSILVLAILLVIRLLMLIVLIIFSPVGFAGMVIPGFRQYATKWWDNLLKYALFGPAAMLMLLVSVTFMRDFKLDGHTSMMSTSTTITANAGSATYLASLATVLVPVILIWMSITIGQTMGIAGAGMVTQRAQQFSKWAGRKASGADAIGKRWKAYSSERDARAAEKFKSNNIGTKFGKLLNRHQDELIATGGGGFYSKGARMDARNRFLAAQKQKADETAKQHGINENMNDTMLKQKHEEARKTKDKSLLAATTKELSRKERGGDMNKLVTDADMQAIDKHFAGMDGIKNSVAEDARNEVAKTNAAVAYGNNEAEMTKAFASGKIKVEDQNGTALTQKLLVAANNAGKLDQKIIDELRKDTAKKAELDKNLSGAVADVEKQYQATMADPSKSAEAKKEAEKQRVRMQQSYFSHTGKFHETVDGTLTGAADMALQAEVFKKADATTLKNVDKKDIGTYSAQIAQNMPIGKLVNAISELNESNTDLARNLASDIKGSGGTAAPGSREKIAYESLKNDRRTQGLMT